MSLSFVSLLRTWRRPPDILDFSGMLIFIYYCYGPYNMSCYWATISELGVWKNMIGQRNRIFCFHYLKNEYLLSKIGWEVFLEQAGFVPLGTMATRWVFCTQTLSLGTAASGSRPWLQPHVTTHSQAPEPGFSCFPCCSLLLFMFPFCLLVFSFSSSSSTVAERSSWSVWAALGAANIPRAPGFIFYAERKLHKVLMQYSASPK